MVFITVNKVKAHGKDFSLLLSCCQLVKIALTAGKPQFGLIVQLWSDINIYQD